MKRSAMVMLSLSFAAVASGQKETDLKKLLDPLTQRAEIEAISGYKPDDYRLHWCPQADQSPPLLIVAASIDFHRSIPDPYAVKRPEELFGGPQTTGGIPGPSPAILSPIVNTALRVLGPDGKDVPAWEDEYETLGYLYDFNGDGVLDCAGSGLKSVEGRGDLDTEVFELRTLERTPRSVLRVVFNWRPDKADDKDDWKVTCEDTDQDGIPEIAFGPKLANTPEDGRRVVIAWKADTQAFEIIKEGKTADDQRHVRILKEGTTLEALAKEGGLGYAVALPQEDRDHAPVPQQPYVFQSLKEATDAEMHAFFNGKERARWSRGMGGKTLLPADFWGLPAKDAALAFARENQKPELRARWQLTVDDREVKPPASGWLTYFWGSASCYSYSSAQFALRFGVAESCLLVTEFNQHGVVGADPLVDRPGHRLRIIPLKAEEARFLADTIFWLNRIRSRDRLAERANSISLSYSSGDGSGTFLLREDHVKPVKLASETVWATSGISENWTKAYNAETFVNLGDWLLQSAVPVRFQEAWQQTTPLDHRSLVVPLAERLKERTSTGEKAKLDEAVTEVLRRHAADPIPPEIFAKVVECTGTERLSGQQTAIKTLLQQLPAATDDEKEHAKLELRPRGDDKLEKRREELQGKYEFDRAYLLREPLQRAAAQLRLVANPAALMEESRRKTPLSEWALKALQSDYPDTYADVLIERFKHEDLDGRRSVFRVLGTLLPKRAKELVAMLDRQQRIDLVIEVTAFQLKEDAAAVPARVPDLMALISDQKGDLQRRGAAMSLLGEMKLDEATAGKLERLLLAELDHPQKGEYKTDVVPEAVEALSKLPTAQQHLDRIVRVASSQFSSFSPILDALVRATQGRADQKEWLAHYLSSKFQGDEGMVDYVFRAALSYDLRGMAGEIEGFATEDAQKEEGDGARSSRGGFKSPQGQRYHLAREITALWQETDAKTRARMWVCLVLHQGVQRGLMEESYDSDKTFVVRAKEAIIAVPAAERRPMIESLLASTAVDYRDEEKDWLRQLAEAP